MRSLLIAMLIAHFAPLRATRRATSHKLGAEIGTTLIAHFVPLRATWRATSHKLRAKIGTASIKVRTELKPHTVTLVSCGDDEDGGAASGLCIRLSSSACPAATLKVHRFLSGTPRSKTSSRSKRVFKLVLTGGPWGGKSSVLPVLKETASARGFDVWLVPEMATVLILAGCEMPPPDPMAFQEAVLMLQAQVEDLVASVATASGGNNAMILDRGVLDGKAYLPSHQWKALLRHHSITEGELLNRYDVVVHMVTAANGAVKSYKFGHVKNDTGASVFRREAPEEAAKLDDANLAAWSAHPHLLEVDNRDDGMEGKIRRANEFVARQLAGALEVDNRDVGMEGKIRRAKEFVAKQLARRIGWNSSPGQAYMG